MLKLASTYFATLLFLLLLDAVWLWQAALPMFRAALGPDLLTFRPVPGVLFYLVYAAGIMVFVIPAAGWQMTALYGALFGLFAYATYDLTNYATLKPWTVQLAATDIVWGMVLTAVASTLGSLCGGMIARRFGG
ncbi:DUF2177 family protein [Acidisphaera sp. L21]|uniref:DUF2177 family protein n=1 Tax=Acidisphaera sp. L21 TaxID=1641851 RepID=UPI00131AD314|nr:DUF2177 family protein [Acidisphaera sp. L21]